jgi:transcriptional regulator with XRE-family HTH domain
VAEDDFAGLLRELKDRSGLSYGVLGKRLHMSASTLHRYVKGEVVPAEFGPVERLARLCRATPEELLELHRRWIRADALRGVKADAGAGAEVDSDSDVSTASHEPGDAPSDDSGPVTVVGGSPSGEAGRSRRRAAWYGGAGVGVAAAVALVVALLPHGGAGDEGPAGAVAGATESPHGSASASASVSPSASARSGSPSASAGASGRVSASPSKGGKPTATAEGAGPAAGAGAEVEETGVPVAVQTTPYYWDVPCEQDFLIDRSPENVPKPPPQQDAVGWGAPLGAVAADRQLVALTVQGTGAETVVVNDLHVRVVGSGAPLDWNRYTMGVGCGGGVGTKSFDVSLDLGNPLVTPINGQRDFPYKVSENDPEVFYVSAHTSGHDVRWYLELDWSSGSRSGTVRVDDHGKPFRTSAGSGDYYGWPLGGKGWEHYDAQ